MRVFALLVASLTLSSCGSKSTPAASGSGSAGSAIAGSAAATAGSAMATTGSGSGSGSATPTATAGSGSATSTATAGSGSAATLDPKFAALDPQERHTCGLYARCKVEGLRDDDPQAESKEPSFENECLTVWVTLHAAEKKKITSCADKVGQCLGPPPCFDSMNLPKK
ncbi:MAG TPA: hypothetical protein VH143_33850 [Kofleriaceae bacterium]|nr:hypothetical protein [Kofleriaceae bacterium]